MDLRGIYPIRAAKRDEWEDAMALAWTTFMKYEAPDYTESGKESFLTFISDERMYQMFLIGEYHLFVAIDDGKGISFSPFDGNKAEKKEKIIGIISIRARTHISLLFVDERYHHRGVGRSLVNYAIMYIREEMGEKIVTVNSAPYAIEFYHRLGFFDTDIEQESDGIFYTPMSFLIR